jgi:GxxExxY protein
MAEEVYQQSLEIELDLREIAFSPKPQLKMSYKGRLLQTKYRPDLLVFGEIIVELKATKELCSEHEAQLFNYMRIARKPVGYLINFGQESKLAWKRFVLSDMPIVSQPSDRDGQILEY